MDLLSKELAWWASLTPSQRGEAGRVQDAMPPWMVESLAAHGVATGVADLTGHSHVYLLPTAVRDFIEAKAIEEAAS